MWRSWHDWVKTKLTHKESLDRGLKGVIATPPLPLPRAVLWSLTGMLCILIVWAIFGQLDIIATAEGKLLPRTFLRIVQPAEGGVLKELLVHEGDLVAPGQVLMRMDTTLSEADTKALLSELNLRKLQLRRIDAELADRPFTRQADDPPELYVKIAAQHQAYRQAYLDSLAQERSGLSKAKHDMYGTVEVMRKLKYTVPFYQKQAATYEKLGKEGFAGALLIEDKQREFVEKEQELKSQEYAVESQLSAIEQSERRIAQITSNYKQQLQTERVQAVSQVEKLSGDWDKQVHKNTLQELKASQHALVKEIATHTPGTVVTPGTVLVTLVPVDEPLIAEVQVKNQDSGFILPRMPARVKVASFPFQKYGMLEGEVAHFSVDASETLGGRPEEISPEGRLAVTANYKAHIRLKSQQLKTQGESFKLLPGMQVIAEIHLGQQSILEYLLSPVQKVVREAARER
jgi:HlyD family secretion protein